MSLGNAFPASFAQAQIKRQLKPGTVVKLSFVMDDGKLHEKRFIVLNISDETLTCVINSKISPLLSTRPHLLKCQVLVKASLHPFMDWDSHADCSRVRSYPTAEVISQLCREPSWIMGEITESLRDDILAGLKASITTSPAITKLCCESLTSFIPR
jgi:hypothetical protein